MRWSKAFQKRCQEGHLKSPLPTQFTQTEKAGQGKVACPPIFCDSYCCQDPKWQLWVPCSQERVRNQLPWILAVEEKAWKGHSKFSLELHQGREDNTKVVGKGNQVPPSPFINVEGYMPESCNRDHVAPVAVFSGWMHKLSIRADSNDSSWICKWHQYFHSDAS